MRTAGVPIVAVHEKDPCAGACEFSAFFAVAPQDLIDDGLFGPLAVAWHKGPYRPVSIQLVAQALGSVQVQRTTGRASYLRSLTLGGAALRGAVQPTDSTGLTAGIRPASSMRQQLVQVASRRSDIELQLPSRRSESDQLREVSSAKI